VDRLFSQERQDAHFESAYNPGMRTALFCLDFQLAAFHPVIEYDAEGVFVRQAGGSPFLFAIRARIDALGQQSARFPERDFRAGAQRDAFLLAGPVVAGMPGFPALGGNVEREPFDVAGRVCRAGRRGLERQFSGKKERR
jgi:hypothetical protein